MKVAIVLGTRPEIIKFSPIIRECEQLGLEYFVLHTGQHYSYDMDKVFFEQLELPEAKYNLDVGSASHGKQTGAMLGGIEKICRGNYLMLFWLRVTRTVCLRALWRLLSSALR